LALGGGSLAWYSRLTDEEKDLVNELAFEIFEKTIEQLGRQERKLLKRKFFLG
jgi:hypothetical protein